MHRAVDIAFALASLFLLFHLVSCQSLHYIETEVDDDNPALTYAADTSAALLSQWNSLNASTAAACAVCVSRGLDPTLVWGGTWHEAHGVAALSFPFTGIGVNVRIVLRNIVGSVTNITFRVDGSLRGRLVRTGDGRGGIDGWLYDWGAFAVGDLTDTDHILTISQSEETIMVLDYLRYTYSTTEDITSSSSVPTSTTDRLSTSVSGYVSSTASPSGLGFKSAEGEPSTVVILVVSVLGCFLLVTGIGALLFVRYRRRKKDELHHAQNFPPAPYYPPALEDPFRRSVGRAIKTNIPLPAVVVQAPSAHNDIVATIGAALVSSDATPVAPVALPSSSPVQPAALYQEQPPAYRKGT